MAEIKEFIVNDRRKFTSEGELRPDAPPSEPKAPRPETLQPAAPPDQYESSARLTESQPSGPQAVPDKPAAAAEAPPEGDIPPPPTAEQTGQARTAYDATVDRLDTAIRASNPGMDRIPEMTFERLIQSVYMQAILQLGGAAEPGQSPQIDLLGARQSIDMLALIEQKTTGNLSESEAHLLQSALFEARMGFLEMTQMLARQAAAKQPGPPPSPNSTGPSIVR